jgi:hypothetical protein
VVRDGFIDLLHGNKVVVALQEPRKVLGQFYVAYAT